MGQSKPWIGYHHASKGCAAQRAPSARDGNSYWKRGQNLLKLGFQNYNEYLNSDLWRNIRFAAYQLHGKLCLICKNSATCIHHLDYALDTLKGTNLNSLIPLCADCHEKVEFDEGKKLSVYEMQVKIKKILPYLEVGSIPQESRTPAQKIRKVKQSRRRMSQSFIKLTDKVPTNVCTKEKYRSEKWIRSRCVICKTNRRKKKSSFCTPCKQKSIIEKGQ